jgi:cysteine synthase
MDAIELVSTEDAYLRAARFARDHGILVGPSSGANLLVADRVAANVVKGRCVVTLLCDRGERYLSEA